ncbi:hypothetical protein MmiAt1_13330 [Methanimicrococcus sp. At1]|uniref:Uncharacterized protein n=1 Tax=Methanimicrococcus hacksteinii TaxID=3028293 RepID=A0ABU3VQP3_9EURY|nr:hypothetical protein [Methanimicrococcus sp. At1]
MFGLKIPCFCLRTDGQNLKKLKKRNFVFEEFEQIRKIIFEEFEQTQKNIFEEFEQIRKNIFEEFEQTQRLFLKNLKTPEKLFLISGAELTDFLSAGFDTARDTDRFPANRADDIVKNFRFFGSRLLRFFHVVNLISGC